MESEQPKETCLDEVPSTKRSISNTRSTRGREINSAPDSNNRNANNSNIGRENSNNNNTTAACGGRRSLQSSFGSPGKLKPSADSRGGNETVITLANNSIEFDTEPCGGEGGPGMDDMPEPEDKEESVSDEPKPFSPDMSPPSAGYDASPDEMDFYEPNQKQVFQMLKGIQKLRTDDEFTDLTVDVQGQEFKCHRFVLANSSSVLSDMIFGKEEDTNTFSANTLNDNTNNNNDDDDETDTNNNSKDRSDDDSNNNNKGLEKPELLKGKTDDTNNNNKNPEKTDILTSKTDDVRQKNFYKREEDAGSNLSENRPTACSRERGGKTSDEQRKIVLNNVGPHIFEKILDFSYCVFDDVMSQDTALQLLLAADTLKMPYLGQEAANFITDKLSPDNVFEVIKLYDSGTTKHFDQKVIWKSHQVLREHFKDLSVQEDFLHLGANHVTNLVMDSMLHVLDEMTVLQALLRWVSHRPEERRGDLVRNLQHIRFPLMTSQELDDVRETPLLKDIPLAKALVTESRLYGTLNYGDRLAWPWQNCVSRRLFPTRDFILWTADRDKGLHFFSLIDGAHHKVTSFNTAAKPAAAPFVFDSTSSVCSYGERIFFSGGEFMTDKLWSVDTRTAAFGVHADMPRGRKLHSVIATGDIVYCLGGQDKRGYTVLDSVDAYITKKDAWVAAGKLAVPAYNMAAVLSHSRQKANGTGGVVYLLGGEDSQGRPLRTIQCFEWLPHTRFYSAFKVEVTGMPPSLFCARTVTSGMDGLVYVVCGDGEIYKFEPEKSHLSHLTTIKNLSENPRQKFGLAHSGGRLHIIGGHQLGHSTNEPIKSVCLDIATQTEVQAPSPLLPGDNINTCVSAKLSINTLSLFL